MALVPVTITEVNRNDPGPATETTGDPVNGHSISNDGMTLVEVRNAGATPRLLTVAYNASVDGGTPDPREFTVPVATSVYKLGYFPVPAYGRELVVTVAHADLKLMATRTA